MRKHSPNKLSSYSFRSSKFGVNCMISSLFAIDNSAECFEINHLHILK